MPALISYEALSDRLALILHRSGCSNRVADLLAKNCAAAERDGAYSHGLFRIPGYVSSLKGNWVDGKAVPRLEDVAPGFLRIDAMNGYAIPALELARPLAIEKVRRNGIAIVAIRNSHHLGALSLDVEPFAASGLVALTLLNSMKSVVPHGGRAAVFGTNPLAFASPRAGGPALIIDQAASVMAYGDVQQAARAGLQVGDGVGIDNQGRKTTDPKAILDGGALCTFGGHKGASIALMIEILCAALVGGHFSYEANLSEQIGAATPRTGQTLILIDPSTGRNQLPDFTARVAELLRAVVAAGQERLPGDRRLAARERSLREGITLTDTMSATLSEIEQALRPQRT